MPGYKTHLGGGLVLAILCLGLLFWLGVFMPTPLDAVVLALICVLGSLFPDVDTDSKGQGVYYSLLFIADAALIATERYKYAAFVGLAAMLPALGHHRGWTHTWWAMLIVPLPIILVPVYQFGFPWEATLPYYAAAVLGYFSHLALDQVI